jgi:hypothetical protein
MRMLLGALALAASILHTGTRARQVETLYMSPANRTIAAFAQNGDLVAWFAPKASKGCNEVWLWQLGSARQPLPREGAAYHNVTCGWQVPADSPVGLAVAANGGAPALLWTLHESAAQALRFDYVIGATVADPIERRFQEVAHASHGAGQWLGGVAGSGDTLVYAVAQVAYKDQVACLSTPKEPGACELKVTGGGIYRIVGRKAPLAIKGAPAAVAVATSGSEVAYVPASGAATADGLVDHGPRGARPVGRKARPGLVRNPDRQAARNAALAAWNDAGRIGHRQHDRVPRRPFDPQYRRPRRARPNRREGSSDAHRALDHGRPYRLGRERRRARADPRRHGRAVIRR